MDIRFENIIAQKHASLQANKSLQSQVKAWIRHLAELLFPPETSLKINDAEDVTRMLDRLKEQLIKMSKNLPNKEQSKITTQVIYFFDIDLQEQIHCNLQKDLSRKFNTLNNDKPIFSIDHILKVYPQFNHIIHYRLAHWFLNRGLSKFSELAACETYGLNGIELDNSCKIGQGFVLAGHNIRIGKGVQIGRNVTIHQGVTISCDQIEINQAVGVIIQDDVTIYAGATIISNKIVIGKGSIIGSQVMVSESLLPNSKLLVNSTKQIALRSHLNRFTIHQLIGNTPLVEVKTIFNTNPNVKIYAKLEGQNPGGSVKDRPAYNMIKQALKRGDIKPGVKLIEPTSGNTGIALAMIACIYGLQIELVMPENSTAERVQTMEAYGAKVILTPANTGIEGSRDYAEAQVQKGGYKMLNQFANPDNYMAHYHSTGPQIWRDTKGQVTHFVSSMGTTGTIMGTSIYLKQKSKDIQIVGVQPTEGSKIPGIRRWAPEYLPKIFNRERVDSIIDVSEEESLVMMRRMAKEQAIFAGMSSGGAMAAAVKLASTLQKGCIVTIVCDRGDRYLSSGIFSNDPKP